MLLNAVRSHLLKFTNVEDSEDLSKLSVAELKERLKAKGLPVGGKKAELIERLSSQEEE